jgi:Flp pilus assembly protein TadG
MIRNRTKNNIANENGQTVAEFALMLPLLMIILLAIIQFGILFKNYLDLTDAVRAGSRRAVVMRIDPGRVQKTKDAVKRAAPDLGLSDDDITVTATSPAWQAGEDVTVTASYPYTIDLLFLPGVVFKSGRMTSTVVERIE